MSQTATVRFQDWLNQTLATTGRMPPQSLQNQMWQTFLREAESASGQARALGLQERALDIEEEQFKEGLEFREREAAKDRKFQTGERRKDRKFQREQQNINLALQAKASEDAADAAKISGITTAGLTGLTLAELIKPGMTKGLVKGGIEAVKGLIPGTTTTASQLSPATSIGPTVEALPTTTTPAVSTYQAPAFASQMGPESGAIGAKASGTQIATNVGYGTTGVVGGAVIMDHILQAFGKSGPFTRRDPRAPNANQWHWFSDPSHPRHAEGVAAVKKFYPGVDHDALRESPDFKALMGFYVNEMVSPEAIATRKIESEAALGRGGYDLIP